LFVKDLDELLWDYVMESRQERIDLVLDRRL
jgi:hypothetical protein